MLVLLFQWEMVSPYLDSFDIQGDDNPEFEKLLAPIKSGDVVYKDDNVVLNETFPLNDLMPNNLDNYWRYLGSLTTPPCSEAVVWTVFQDTLNISQAQADYLMNNLYHGYEEDHHNDFIQGNFRPVQPLNGRTVEASFNWINFSYSFYALYFMLVREMFNSS